MKCIAAVALLALASVVLADTKPLEADSLEPAKAAPVEPENARDKRGLLIGAAYTAPVAYSAYTAPALAYTGAYSAYPYAYTAAAYSSYPYYAAAYNAPYILA